MSEQKFEPGTIVRLKSGGPKMTVVHYGQYGFADQKSYKCKWFDERNKLTQDTFTEAELEPYPTGSGYGNVSLERG